MTVVLHELGGSDVTTIQGNQIACSVLAELANRVPHVVPWLSDYAEKALVDAQQVARLGCRITESCVTCPSRPSFQKAVDQNIWR